jgi:putative transposase
MSNHYHLLFEIADPWHISSMMAGMAKAYTTYHHARHQTSGYLWQGRFKSQPIQKERYLLACARYIERNPVKAQIVEKAPIYMYSSALYYCSGIKDLITSEDPTYRDFGQNLEQRRNSYRQFLSMCDPKEEKLFDNMNAPQGDEWFSKKLIKHKGRYMPRIKGGPMNTQRSPTINSFCNKLHPN